MLTLKKTCITLYILLYYIIFLATIGVSFFALFGPFRANVGFGVRFKNFFVTYICRQLTLICKYSHVLFFNSATLGLFCTFRALQGYLLAMGANFGVGVMFNKNFGTYQCRLLIFWKYSPIFLIWQNLGPFGVLETLWGYFWGCCQVQKLFRTYLYRQSTLVLEVQPYLFVFNSATFGASFALFWALWG